MNIKSQCASIEREFVVCHRHCAGIVNDPHKGILPRGLHYEVGDGGDLGIISCGMNPGRSKPAERSFYLKNNNTAEAVNAYYTTRNFTFPYFNKVRGFLTAFGHRGPILWTNIAKCEAPTQNRISFDSHPQTFRTCSNLFLKREINIAPESWLILACGKDAFAALAYLLPKRRILGIPHPTGATPNFSRLFGDRGQLKPEFVTGIPEYWMNEPQGALWLPELANKSQERTE